jgi:tRNA (guanosine-2'-O-)-methyltransferase
MKRDKRELLTYLENFITDNRKEGFLGVLKNRTKHFTVAMEDVYQLHNTSAVMRSCEVFGIQELHVVEQKLGKELILKLLLAPKNGLILPVLLLTNVVLTI